MPSRQHPDWGQGTVQRYDARQMTVRFDAVGYKTLAVERRHLALRG